MIGDKGEVQFTAVHAGMNVGACEECGALAFGAEYRQLHIQWHEDLERWIEERATYAAKHTGPQVYG